MPKPFFYLNVYIYKTMLKNNKTSIYSIVLLCFKYLKNKKELFYVSDQLNTF